MRRRVFVTGSTTGLGRAAAESIIEHGQDVVVHARTAERVNDLGPLATQALCVVIGDLADTADVRSIADQANGYGPFDAVIHNAGIYVERTRVATAEGHPRVLAVNVLASYMLTALVERPARLIYLTSGMHHDGRPSLDDLDWLARRWNGTQAYSDSKLLLTTFAAALARRWTDTYVNAVDPGWVPTRMGGPGATDDLVQGHTTQVWLATSEQPEATVTGHYWYHKQVQDPAPAVQDAAFQNALLDELVRLTGVALP
jgi:NAD(P)-dependent dehydrogenase (short-subunit alcohol dehydrogenase family)